MSDTFVTFVTMVKIEEERYMPKGTGKVIAQNKKAFHDYFIEETYEARACPSRNGN